LRDVNAPKCICGQGSTRSPTGGAYSTPQTPSWIWGKEWGRKGEVKEGGWRGGQPLQTKILATALSSAERCKV